MYFLKTKKDTVSATKKFIADTATHGRIKSLRSDNRFKSNDFQRLLCDNSIRHETSAPYSPLQNGTAERNWRALFDMARCMVIENNLPKILWTYAVIRNRCFNNCLKQTPYNMITGRMPDQSKMNIFGSTFYAYKNLKKLDPKCEKGIFVGYDRNSPAYLVFYPEDNRVLKHRLIKFITKETNQQTQTYPTDDDDDDDDYFPQMKYVQNNTSATTPDPQIKTTETQDNAQTDEDSKLRHYPRRERKPPEYLNDCITNSEDDSDHALINFDYCYKAT